MRRVAQRDGAERIVRGVAFIRLSSITGVETVVIHPERFLPEKDLETLRVRVWLSYGSTLLSELPKFSFIDMQELNMAGYVLFGRLGEPEKLNAYALVCLFNREIIPLIWKLEKRICGLMSGCSESVEKGEDTRKILQRLYSDIRRLLYQSETVLSIISEMANLSVLFLEEFFKAWRSSYTLSEVSVGK